VSKPEGFCTPEVCRNVEVSAHLWESQFRAVLPPALLLHPGGRHSGNAGTVLDDQGKATVNALVIISTVSAEKTGAKTPVPVSAPTDSKGNFTLAGVVPGTYTVCVLAPNNLLNPCEWSPATSRLTVVSGKAAAPLNITLVTGTTAHIHIQDSDAVVSTPFQQPKTNGVLAAGVIDAQGYSHPAHYSSTDGTTHTFDLRIPFSTDLKLWIAGANLQVTDQNGAPLASTPSNPSAVINANQGGAAIDLIYQAHKAQN
jgi:hypothetical protein